jgi:hypothetical protein
VRDALALGAAGGEEGRKGGRLVKSFTTTSIVNLTTVLKYIVVLKGV